MDKNRQSSSQRRIVWKLSSCAEREHVEYHLVFGYSPGENGILMVMVHDVSISTKFQLFNPSTFAFFWEVYVHVLAGFASLFYTFAGCRDLISFGRPSVSRRGNPFAIESKFGRHIVSKCFKLSSWVEKMVNLISYDMIWSQVIGEKALMVSSSLQLFHLLSNISGVESICSAWFAFTSESKFKFTSLAVPTTTHLTCGPSFWKLHTTWQIFTVIVLFQQIWWQGPRIHKETAGNSSSTADSHGVWPGGLRACQWCSGRTEPPWEAPRFSCFDTWWTQLIQTVSEDVRSRPWTMRLVVLVSLGSWCVWHVEKQHKWCNVVQIGNNKLTSATKLPARVLESFSRRIQAVERLATRYLDGRVAQKCRKWWFQHTCQHGA